MHCTVDKQTISTMKQRSTNWWEQEVHATVLPSMRWSWRILLSRLLQTILNPAIGTRTICGTKKHLSNEAMKQQLVGARGARDRVAEHQMELEDIVE
jgi:hypothetical protein